MSVKAMNWVWNHSRSSGNNRVVLLALADRANDEGQDTWPSIATLAKKANAHQRTVQRCLRELEEMKEIRAVGIHRSGSTIYQVVMEQPEERGGNLPPPSETAESPTPRDEHSESAAATPVHESSPSRPEPLPEGESAPTEDRGAPTSPPPANCHPPVEKPVENRADGEGWQIATGGDVATPPVADCRGRGGDVATPPVANCHPIRPVRPVRTSTSSTTAASPRSPRELSRDPNDNGNYRVIERIAIEALNSGETFASDADLIEAVKCRCATLLVNYGDYRAPRQVQMDVVHRAVASAQVKVRLKFGQEVATA